MRNFLMLAIVVLAGCASEPPGPKTIAYVDAPRFCRAKIQAYSDFAYLRPSEETVIGNNCGENWDALGDAPVVWVVTAEVEDPVTGKKSPEKKMVLSQPFKHGQTEIHGKNANLSQLARIAKENPNRTVRIIGFASQGETTKVAEQRATAVKNWLINAGIEEGRISIAPPGVGAAKADAEIIVKGKG